MAFDTIVYDRQREAYVITRSRLPRLAPIPFSSEQHAERFIQLIDCSNSVWRTLLNSVSLTANTRASKDHSIKKQLIHALKSSALQVYRKKQYDLHHLVKIISFDQSERLTLEIPCQWHINPRGVKQHINSEEDALKLIGAFSANDDFWRNVIAVLADQQLKPNPSNDAKSDVAKLMTVGALCIYKHNAPIAYLAQKQPSPEPTRTPSPASSLKQRSPEPEQVKATQIRVLKQAAKAGTPFCEECKKDKANAPIKQAS
jgi:hypothetical protein